MAQIQPDHLSDSSSDSAFAILLRHLDMSDEENALRGVLQQPRRSREQHSNALCEDQPEVEASSGSDCQPEHEPDQCSCFGQDGNIAATACAVCCEDIKVHNELWMAQDCCTLTSYNRLFNLDYLMCRWLLLPSAITKLFAQIVCCAWSCCTRPCSVHYATVT